nr:crosslink repair DNA glycosylase YcaQ family protein [Solimicrobium silvestre]
MADNPTLKLSAARNLHLAAQGLLTPPAKNATKKQLLATIRQMAALQIDTINVVARSPYLVLWSRLGSYETVWLNELLEEGKLFEYWSHEACFLPIEDYYLYRHQMIAPHGLGWKFNQRWLLENKKEVELVRKQIHSNGASRSLDFAKRDGKAGGWWEWKPEKRSLEVLFTMGELMVAKRHNFQRVYDLRERVHPKWEDQHDLIHPLECQRQQVLLAVKALGCAKATWITDYFRMAKLDASNQAAALAEQGLLLTANVAGWDTPVYVHPDHADLLEQAAEGNLKATATQILSPFDPVVWDRKRAIELFDFDYKLECYTPAEKRRYGYFSLPILRRGAIIGRMDAKAHRQQGRFEVKSLHMEAEVKISATLVRDVIGSITKFAQWHGTPELDLSSLKTTEFYHNNS